MTDQIKEGDIFRWRYRDSGPNDHGYGVYHCCSCIAIVTKGRLRDTFWSSGSDGRSFGLDELARLELTYLGNLADLEQSHEWNADYYDDADIVNLNHSNSTRDNFYIRKGAKRSPTKMLAVARQKLEQCASDKRSIAWREERLHVAIAEIEAGEFENTHL